MDCTFEGTAQRIEIQGAGTSNMVRADAFAEGIAERVELLTAQVGGLYPPVEIGAIDELDPVDLDPSESRPYKVTYVLGEGAQDSRPVSIDIEAGAARSGRYKGSLAGAPECSGDAGCLITWQDAKHIALILQPGPGAKRAAESGKPIRLTGWFPYVKGEAESPRKDHLDLVVLDRATGTLVCDGQRTEVSGRLLWSAGVDRSMRVDEPGIQSTPGGLRLAVTSTFLPEGAGRMRPWWALGVAAALLVVAAALVLVRSRSRGAKTSTLGSQAPSESTPTEGHEEVPESVTREIALLVAEPDLEFAEALGRHFAPAGKVLFNPHDPACVPPGEDLTARTRRAIDRARVVAVLVSADFFAAPEPWPTLLGHAMTRHRNGKLVVVPVLCRVCAWQKTVLGALAPAPRTGVIEKTDNDSALLEVVNGLLSLLDKPSGGN